MLEAGFLTAFAVVVAIVAVVSRYGYAILHCSFTRLLGTALLVIVIAVVTFIVRHLIGSGVEYQAFWNGR